MPVEMDVRNSAQVQSGVDKIRERWGAIDILINNAGISGLTAIDDPDDRRWRDIVETNLTGSYFVTKEVLKTMKSHAHGRIINVSSVLGKFGVPGYSAYCSAKHGIIGFTRAVALEVRDGVPDRVVLEVPHVRLPGGVGQHLEHVERVRTRLVVGLIRVAR